MTADIQMGAKGHRFPFFTSEKLIFMPVRMGLATGLLPGDTNVKVCQSNTINPFPANTSLLEAVAAEVFICITLVRILIPHCIMLKGGVDTFEKPARDR